MTQLSMYLPFFCLRHIDSRTCSVEGSIVSNFLSMILPHFFSSPLYEICIKGIATHLHMAVFAVQFHNLSFISSFGHKGLTEKHDWPKPSICGKIILVRVMEMGAYCQGKKENGAAWANERKCQELVKDKCFVLYLNDSHFELLKRNFWGPFWMLFLNLFHF